MRLVPGRRRCIKPRITMTPRLRPSRIALGPSNHSRDRLRRLSTISNLECSISTLPPIPERSRRDSGPAGGRPPTRHPEQTAPHAGWSGIWDPPLAIASIQCASSPAIAATPFRNDAAWSHTGRSLGERVRFTARRGRLSPAKPQARHRHLSSEWEAASCWREDPHVPAEQSRPACWRSGRRSSLIGIARSSPRRKPPAWANSAIRRAALDRRSKHGIIAEPSGVPPHVHVCPLPPGLWTALSYWKGPGACDRGWPGCNRETPEPPPDLASQVGPQARSEG